MAGVSTKDIRLRIRSVENTMQITKAMQLVAASKIRRAKERMENSRAYAEVSRKIVAALVSGCEDKNAQFIAQRPLHRRCYIVIAGERGLAGGYNNNIFKAVAADSEGLPYCVFPLGRKAIEKYQRSDAELLNATYSRVEGLTLSGCYRIARTLIEGYLQAQYDEVRLVYTVFRSMLSQEVQIEPLLPIAESADDSARSAGTEYELSIEETLSRVVPDYLAGRIYGALCDSFLSEVTSRRNAMDSATKNADAMISDLTLKYNRARQGAITQEITEIVAGAEE